MDIVNQVMAGAESNVHALRLESKHHAPFPRFTVLPPLSLYVHIPWCVRKCPYCDFNSHQAGGPLPERAYVDALITDLESALPLIWGRKIHSVFFGGGTPSLFSAAGIDRLLSAIRARTPLTSDVEVTLECNPGTFEVEKFRAYRAAGVNRLSIGVQSFNAQHLKQLGRIHDDREARAAIETALSCFDNINLDLMYGLPSQSPAEALADIQSAICFAPQHLSVYHLSLEPNTYFYRHPPALPGDDEAAHMQQLIEELLARESYARYETSAFARPGRQARHNLNYWTFGDYLGIGAGAHSKISSADCIVRQVRHLQPKRYMEHAVAGNAIAEEHDVEADAIGFEFMMNALRLTGGFQAALFEERTGTPLSTVLPELERAEARGLIHRDYQRVTPTPLGQRFLNDLLQIFLP